MSEWQPIATAPKDGTRILCRSKYGEVYHAKWLPEDDENYACWWNEQADDEGCPVWWMEALPDPPTAIMEDKRGD